MSDARAMSFKARMKQLAVELGLRPQTVIQNFMFERFLERLAKSAYRENFIVKGGVLISALIGLKARSTMDMDATAVDLPMTQRSVRRAVEGIVAVDVADDVAFAVVGMDRIRVQVEGYEGIRVKLRADFHGLRVPFSIDVTKGDAITPKPVQMAFASHFEGGGVSSLLAYAVETVLAEKCESILKRNVVGTRPRDYYDVYMLTRLKKIRPRVFARALHDTFERCGTSALLEKSDELLEAIGASSVQEEYWRRYQREFPYAQSVSFADAIGAVRRLLGC